MNIVLKIVLLVILGYACGNISFAKLFSKRRKANIEKSGSGNPGTMNMLRTHGAVLGFVTLFFDAIKAALPALFALIWVGQMHSAALAEIALYLTGFAAVLGHIYPIVNKFKGGKGIASTFGVFLVANPLVAGILFVVCFISFLFIKIGSLASMIFILSFGIYQTVIFAINGTWISLAIMWAIILIDVYAHRENIKRLLANTERITSFQEGVKKDLENIKQKKQRKLQKKFDKEELIEDKFKHKEDLIEDKYKQKLEKRTNRLERKLNKKVKKNAKKVKRVEKKFNKKADKISARKDSKIWRGLAKWAATGNTIDNTIDSSDNNNLTDSTSNISDNDTTSDSTSK